MFSSTSLRRPLRTYAAIGLVALLLVLLSSAFARSFAYAHESDESLQLDLQVGTLEIQQEDDIDDTLQVQAGGSSDISWHRIYGAAALDTMLSIVKQGDFPKGGCIVLATVDGYWDALTANGVAGLVDAPVVMTDSNTLSNQASQVIAMMKPRRIVICGGVKAISANVEKAAKQVAGAGVQVTRLWGDAADDTAIDVYKRGFAAASGDDGSAWSSTAFLCTDNGYWDALSVASVAYAKHMPIFLTRDKGTKVSAATIDVLKGGFSHVYVVGGSMAVSDSVIAQLKKAGVKVEKRIYGQDAVGTSVAAANFALSHGMTVDNIGVATTSGYWDALAGAAFCGHRNSVLVLAGESSSSTIRQIIDPNRGQIENGYAFGGPNALTPNVYGALLGGNGLQRVLGFTRDEYVQSIFANWSSGHQYVWTPYVPLSPKYRYTSFNDGLYWPRGLKSPTGVVGMNCAGFVARTIYDMGTDMWNDDYMADFWAGGPDSIPGHWMTVVPYYQLAWKYGVTVYEFSSKWSLLNSGLAERGDIIAMYCSDLDGGGWDDDGVYHPCGHDCHVGIFWGSTPSEDLFLHAMRPHCAQTPITPVCWGSTYYLIKFD